MKIKVGDKVLYSGKKYRVKFIHDFESHLTKYSMVDISRKGNLLCVMDFKLSVI